MRKKFIIAVAVITVFSGAFVLVYGGSERPAEPEPGVAGALDPPGPGYVQATSRDSVSLPIQRWDLAIQRGQMECSVVLRQVTKKGVTSCIRKLSLPAV